MTMLVSLTDMKTYLGETTTTYDSFLTDQITIVSDSIEGYCGRKFLSASYTEEFYGEDYLNSYSADKLFAFHYPITSVTSVKEIEVLADATENSTTIATTEYLLRPDTGLFRRKTLGGPRKPWFSVYGFTSRVEMIYTAGFSTAPTPILDVVYNLVEQRYGKKISGVDLGFGNDVQRLAIPGVMSIDFDYTLQVNERKTAFGMILGNYVNILDMYRSDRTVIGAIKENYVQ